MIYKTAAVSTVFLLIAAVIILSFCCKEPEDSAEKTAEAAVIAYAQQINTASLIVLKDGISILEFGDITHRYLCHSIRKPLLGALIGIYADRGVIDIQTPLAELGINDIAPSLTLEEKSATIQDLLLSRSGIYHEAGGESQTMIENRPLRGSHPAGTYFYYNNWDFNALGTIFRQLTGTDIFTAFYNDIAIQIGMPDFNPDDCFYSYENSKSLHPSYFFRMSARDLARFGLLYQQYGNWAGRQIVPEDWIHESTKIFPVAGNEGDPYGYLWRIIPAEAGLGFGFYHTGFGGHLLAVFTDMELVIVHRVDTDNGVSVPVSELLRLVKKILEI